MDLNQNRIHSHSYLREGLFVRSVEKEGGVDFFFVAKNILRIVATILLWISQLIASFIEM